MCKGGNPNTLKLKIKQICKSVERIYEVGPQLCIQYNLSGFGAFQMKNNQFRFFSKKIVTSHADIFTMENALFKIIFWHKIFICCLIFKIFVAHFKTFRMQNGDMVILFMRSFRKVRF